MQWPRARVPPVTRAGSGASCSLHLPGDALIELVDVESTGGFGSRRGVDVARLRSLVLARTAIRNVWCHWFEQKVKLRVPSSQSCFYIPVIDPLRRPTDPATLNRWTRFMIAF